MTHCSASAEPLSRPVAISRPRGWQHWVWQVVLFVLIAANLEMLASYRLHVEGIENQGAWAQRDATTLWRLRPNLKLAVYAHRTPDVSTNEDGLRDENIPFPRPPGEFRVLCVGGSVTFGTGLPPQATWPRLLELRLRERAPHGIHIRVINAGQPGFSTFKVAALIEELTPRYQPNLVVGMFGTTDCHGVSTYHTQNTPATAQEIYLRNLFYHSATYRYLCARLVPFNALEDPAEIGKSGLDCSCDNIRHITKYVTSSGARLLVAVEATRRTAVMEGNHRHPLEVDRAQYSQFEAACHRLGRVCSLPPILICNRLFAATGLSDNELFLPDDPMHTTLRGSGILADAIADAIWKRGLAPHAGSEGQRPPS